jgi:hypothetical protein
MQEKIISVPCEDGTSLEVTLISWGLRRQLRENNVVIPLIKEPFINAMAVAGSFEEDMQILAIIEGIMGALAGIDLEKLAERLMDGDVWYRPKNGASKKAASLDLLEKEGVGIAGILKLCTDIITHNYGTLLKKDLLASFLPTAPTEA